MGASYPEEYIDRATELGYRGLGLCDYDGVYGIVRAYRRHKELASSLQVFYGAEIHLQADHHRPLVYRDTLVFYALNLRGYGQLSRLLSLAHQNSKNEARLELAHLLQLPTTDLLCIQPMRGLIRRSRSEDLIQRYALLREYFPQRFYLALSRHLNPLEDAWITPTLRLSQQLDIPCIFSQDAYFHEPATKEVSDVLQAIRLNKTIDQVIPHLFVNSERSLQALPLLEQRYRCFSDSTSIIRQSQDLAARFDFSLAELRYHYPQEFLPLGYKAQTYLEELTWQAAGQRYGQRISTKIKDLLQHELRLVYELGFADYFLTVWDIVRWARTQAILCQGRGSAANSAICFVLGISSVDPACFDVLFERFISRERGDPPDIDVDFEHERREEVIQYIYQRYGRQRAAMVANVITFRERSALRSVGKALGISAVHLQESSHRQEMHLHKVTPHIQGENAHSPSEIKDEKSVPWEIWHRLALRIKGFPHHMGIHSGGFVVTQEALDLLCPQEPATMPGRTVIQWSKEDIEYLHVFKIDVLALGMLTVLRKAMHMIAQCHRISLELSSIPADDQATYQMIQRAETVGTFQIESRAQMSMLPRLRPQNFYDLVIQIGIIRPGPIQGGLIHPFLRRRQGLEPVIFPDPRLEPILRRTLGVPIFQEQVMRIAIAVGDFSAGEADQLRKHIGAWSLNKEWGPIVEKLESGMRRNGIKEHFIRQILDHLKGFANYGFPESHATSFAILAYASAYIKCHYKEAFYTALLNSQPVGFYSIHALVQCARREGLTFLPIDVQYSDWDSRIDTILQENGEKIFRIRLGMRLVKGLSRDGAELLLSKRSIVGSWAKLRDFLEQSQLSRRDLGALAAAQALASFGLERKNALWLTEGAPLAPLLDEEEAYAFQGESELERVERDFDSFATTLGEHPAKIIRERHWAYSLASRLLSRAHDLERKADRTKVHIFGLVLVRQAPMTAKGMRFFTLEDETGYINLVFTPQTAEAFSALIHDQGFICATGRLQKEGEKRQRRKDIDHSHQDEVFKGHSVLVEEVHRPLPADCSPIPIHEKKRARENTTKEDLVNKLPPARNYH